MMEGPYDHEREPGGDGIGDDAIRDFMFWELEFDIPPLMRANLWPTRFEMMLTETALWWNDHMPVSLSFFATWLFVLHDALIQRRVKRGRFGPWKRYGRSFR